MLNPHWTVSSSLLKSTGNLSNEFSSDRDETLIDVVDVFEDGPEDSEDEKSGSESSDNEESKYDELEEFWELNADCTSGSVEFIDDNNEPPMEMCISDVSEDRERGNENKVRSMIIRIIWHKTYNICQCLLPPVESAPNPLEIKEVIWDPAIDISLDLNHSIEIVCEPEVTDIPPVMEGWGGQKHYGKHPSTLYECDCREIIIWNEIEQGNGLIKCNKAGCETR